MSASDPLVGQVLNRAYRVVSLIAEGGMSIIYEAERQRIPRRRVALKMLHPLAAGDEVMAARFAQEAEILAEMDHPHIVEMLDANHTDEGQAYYVMELLEGETLRQRLDRDGRLPVDEVLEFTEQVGSAVAALHEHKFVHRDLIPENIFLQQHPEALIHTKLIDLNLALWLKKKVDARAAAEVEGTVGYMSPEQARGQVAEIGPATDVFALAAVIYEALGGKPAFPDAETEEDYLYQVNNRDPTPITARVPALSREVHQVLSRGMARKKEDRYSSVEAMADALYRALAGLSRDTVQGFEAAPMAAAQAPAPGAPDRVAHQERPAPAEVDDKITHVMGLPELGITPPLQEQAGITEIIPEEELPSEVRVTEVVAEEDLSAEQQRVTQFLPEEEAQPHQRVTKVVPEEDLSAEQQRVTQFLPEEEAQPDQRVTVVVPEEDLSAEQQRVTQFLPEEDLDAIRGAPVKDSEARKTAIIEDTSSQRSERPRPPRALKVGRQPSTAPEENPDAPTMLLDPDRESWPQIPPEEGRSGDSVHDAPTMMLDPLRKEAGGQEHVGAHTQELAGYLTDGGAGKSVVVVVGVAAVVLLGAGLVYLFGDDGDAVDAPTPPAVTQGRPVKSKNKGSGTYSVEVKRQRPAPAKPAPREPAAVPRPAPRPTRPIHLTSIPDGAEVYVAGRRIGKTPLKVLTLPDSSLFFLFQKAGFRDWSKTVPPGEEEARVQAVLKALPARRPEQVRTVVAPTPKKASARKPVKTVPRVVSRPTGKLRVGTMHDGAPLWADIFLDGRRVGQTPLVLKGVKAGSRRVEARRRGFRRISKQVVVQPGKQAAVLLELRK